MPKGSQPRPFAAKQAGSAPVTLNRPTPGGDYPRGNARPISAGIGRGKGGGLPIRKGFGGKRMRKVKKDSVRAITKGDIRRLARRGGVKRISGVIYDDIRNVLKDRIRVILTHVVAVTEYRQRQTVTLDDVIFSLRRLTYPIWGFDCKTKANSKVNLYA